MTAIVVIMFFGEPFGGLIPGAHGAVLATLMRTGEPLSGRQIAGLVSEQFSLRTVQKALDVLTSMGVVVVQRVGRASLHTVNESHVMIAPLRDMLDPISALTSVVAASVDEDVSAVILFGSVARGDASRQSDIDLAVIAKPGWDGQLALQDAVSTRLGNRCDVLVLSAANFRRRAGSEPVIADILHDGCTLFGEMPSMRRGAA